MTVDRATPSIRRLHIDYRPLVMLWLATVGGCHAYRPSTFSGSPSADSTGSGTFRAGFARVDITPPPGAGLMGWGTEGLPAVGHRQRLFARAMYLEDMNGGRVAIVVLDVGETSAVLHRMVAQNLNDPHLGYDRIFLAATHTHSGPSHFFGVPAFDELGSAVSGYDPVLSETLARRIATAIRLARASADTARVAWGLAPVWGLTRIRSWPAYIRNDEGVRARVRSRFVPPPGLPLEEAGVDPTLGILRVDVLDRATRKFKKRGAFAVFAIHGTIVSQGQRFYDSDIQGRVAALMEQHIDPAGMPFDPKGIYLFANGGQGDVSPNIDPRARCPTPRLVRQPVSRGPRGAPFETTWRMIPRDTSRDALCIPLSLSELERIAKGLVAQSKSLYDSLGSEMENQRSGSHLITSAFTILHSPDDKRPSLLCPPKEGVATLLGAADGWTRLRWDWDLLFTDSVTYAPLPSGAGVVGTDKCHKPKRIFLFPAERIVLGRHLLPAEIQLGLVKIGPIGLAIIPGEPTSNSAWTIRRAAATSLFGPRSSADSVLMVSLTNGYIQYVATPSEYPLQFYEGSATIFGPNELSVIAAAFRDLAMGMLSPGGAPRHADTLLGWWKKGRSIVRWEDTSAGNAESELWRDFRGTIGPNVVRAEWIGPSPAEFHDSTGTRIIFERRTGAVWHPVAWDNLPTVEVEIRRIGKAFVRKAPKAMYVVTWRTSILDPDALRVRLVRGTMGSASCRDFRSGEIRDC